jgi:uncharacterized Zn finger protein (UPF0148 family)
MLAATVPVTEERERLLHKCNACGVPFSETRHFSEHRGGPVLCPFHDARLRQQVNAWTLNREAERIAREAEAEREAREKPGRPKQSNYDATTRAWFEVHNVPVDLVDEEAAAGDRQRRYRVPNDCWYCHAEGSVTRRVCNVCHVAYPARYTRPYPYDRRRRITFVPFLDEHDTREPSDDDVIARPHRDSVYSEPPSVQTANTGKTATCLYCGGSTFEQQERLGDDIRLVAICEQGGHRQYVDKPASLTIEEEVAAITEAKAAERARLERTLTRSARLLDERVIEKNAACIFKVKSKRDLTPKLVFTRAERRAGLPAYAKSLGQLLYHVGTKRAADAFERAYVETEVLRLAFEAVRALAARIHGPRPLEVPSVDEVEALGWTPPTTYHRPYAVRRAGVPFFGREDRGADFTEWWQRAVNDELQNLARPIVRIPRPGPKRRADVVNLWRPDRWEAVRLNEHEFLPRIAPPIEPGAPKYDRDAWTAATLAFVDDRRRGGFDAEHVDGSVWSDGTCRHGFRPNCWYCWPGSEWRRRPQRNDASQRRG